MIPYLYVVGGNTNYANWIVSTPCETMAAANLVMFTGGVDVNPAIYHKHAHPSTEPSNYDRDAKEKEAFEMAYAMRIPMIGICRGAQFLCAMAGGILVQHQKHPSQHYVHTIDGRQILSTSDHHQRAYPFNLKEDKYKLIGWAKQGLSPYNHGEDPNDDMTGKPEAEIVYYPEIRALGIQSHPEWFFPANDQETLESLRYHRTLVQLLLTNNL